MNSKFKYDPVRDSAVNWKFKYDPCGSRQGENAEVERAKGATTTEKEKRGLNTAIWRQELGRRVVRHPDLTAFPVGRVTPDTGRAGTPNLRGM
eukprot:scaffold1275_cov65-Phaeocystis_antarctica.AAC.1